MFGERVRELRESKGFFLRQLAAHLEIDTAYVSKIETGGKKASREQVLGIAGFLEADPDELLALWMADRVHEIVADEDQAIRALDIVKRRMKKA